MTVSVRTTLRVESNCSGLAQDSGPVVIDWLIVWGLKLGVVSWPFAAETAAQQTSAMAATLMNRSAHALRQRCEVFW